MSMEKFASLHSGLIARKGEASPTPPVNLDVFNQDKSVPPVVTFPVAALNCEMPDTAVRPKRPRRIAEDNKSGVKALTFRLDPALYHRVQVAAAKLGWTSQDLLRAAVEGHLAHLGRDVFPNCGCIGGKDGCG
ncbi:MAG: hypothetical protein ABL951_11475 [Alphaproteobacteria bacterium]